MTTTAPTNPLEVSASSNVWTVVSLTNFSGKDILIQNIGDLPIRVEKLSSGVPDTDGLILQQGEVLSYNATSGYNLYFKPTLGFGKIRVETK